MSKISKKTVLTVLTTFLATAVLTAAVIVFVLYRYMPFSKFFKVMTLIENTYVEEVDFEKCEEDAINGVLAGLGDKYAVYYDEENAKETLQMVDGYYYGIGVEIFANTKKDRIEVISAYEDSPADVAGFKSGDLIKSVDGKEFFSKDVADMVSYIKNPEKGPKDLIEIVVLREDKEITLRAKRGKIDLYKVKSEMVGDICYISYGGFTQSSYEAFEKIVNSLDSKKVKGIVVDIRNNPGGELNSALNMCDIFLEDQVIMRTKNKSGEETVYSGKKGSCDIPLAVLVNHASASASEVFAGALQDHKRAVIVGEKTYGKGVTQSIRYVDPFDKGEGALKLTTYKNFTPNGKWINKGIKPDVKVKDSEKTAQIKSDAAFIAATEYLIKEYVKQ